MILGYLPPPWAQRRMKMPLIPLLSRFGWMRLGWDWAVCPQETYSITLNVPSLSLNSQDIPQNKFSKLFIKSAFFKEFCKISKLFPLFSVFAEAMYYTFTHWNFFLFSFLIIRETFPQFLPNHPPHLPTHPILCSFSICVSLKKYTHIHNTHKKKHKSKSQSKQAKDQWDRICQNKAKWNKKSTKYQWISFVCTNYFWVWGLPVLKYG